MSDYMGDLSTVFGVGGTDNTGSAGSKTGPTVSKKDRSTLDLNDYLKLMVAMFQNQTIDNTADIGDMMNNMVQMSVVQAISSISSLIEESTALNYAASLVGKQVTVGIINNGQLTEIEGYVAATGTYNGQQVIFLKDKNGNPIEGYVPITSIMAIGWLSETGASGEIVEPEEPELPGVDEDPEAPGGNEDPDNPGVDEELGGTGGAGETERPEADGFGGPMESGGTDEAEETAGAAGAGAAKETDGDDAVGEAGEIAGVGAVSGADGFGEPMGTDD